MFVDKTAALVVDLLDLASRRQAVQVQPAAYRGDAVLAGAYQTDPQSGVRRQYVRRAVADDHATALLAQRADHSNQTTDVAALAPLRRRDERLDAFQQPILPSLVDLFHPSHRQTQFPRD